MNNIKAKTLNKLFKKLEESQVGTFTARRKTLADIIACPNKLLKLHIRQCNALKVTSPEARDEEISE